MVLGLFLFFLFILVPFVLWGIRMYTVIKKSVEKKSPEFLANEKIEMQNVVDDLKQSIHNWKDYGVSEISSTADYNFVKSITRRLTGHLLSNDGTPIVAYQRIERGFKINCRILAATTDFRIYYEYNGSEIMFYYNDKYFGKIDNQYRILNSRNVAIGSANHFHNSGYSIVINKKDVAFVNRAVDMSTIKKNPFYDSNRKTSMHNPIFIEREQVEAHARVTLEDGISDEEIKWVAVISIFESIYYGFDFL